MEHYSSKARPDRVDTYMDMVPKVSRYLDVKYGEVVEDGLDNIIDGPAMYIANHLAFDDSLAIAAVFANATDRPLRLGAKSEYFAGLGINNKGLFGKQIKKFVEDTQQIPVYRDDNVRGAVSLSKEIKHRFSVGESVLLHAEGTRSPDGRLNKFKHGAAAFAIKNSVPIVPVSVTYDRHHLHLRKFVTVQFGEPLTPQVYGMDFHHPHFIPDGLVNAVVPRVMNQSERVNAVTDLLEQRVAEMSGQERSGYFVDPHTKKLIIPEEQ